MQTNQNPLRRFWLRYMLCNPYVTCGSIPRKMGVNGCLGSIADTRQCALPYTYLRRWRRLRRGMQCWRHPSRSRGCSDLDPCTLTSTHMRSGQFCVNSCDEQLFSLVYQCIACLPVHKHLILPRAWEERGLTYAPGVRSCFLAIIWLMDWSFGVLKKNQSDILYTCGYFITKDFSSLTYTGSPHRSRHSWWPGQKGLQKGTVIYT